MTRTQIYLSVLLVLQVALILFVRMGSADAATDSRAQALLPEFEQSAIERLAIADGTTSLELQRQGDGWGIAELDGYPADTQKVSDLLNALSAARVGRPTVTSDRYHDSLKVADDDFQARLSAWSAGDAVVADLLLGTSPGLRTSHVRHAGNDAVFEARGISTHDYRATAESWIERTLIDESLLSVSGFSLTNAQGTVDAVRVEGSWQTAEEGRPLDPEKVNQLLRQATVLRVESAAGRVDLVGHGLENPEATLRLRIGDEPEGTRDVTLLFGTSGDEEASTRYVTRSDFNFSAIVRASTVSEILTNIDFEATDG